MRVIGVDQSMNHTGVCILDLDGRNEKLSLIEPRKLYGAARLAAIRDALRRLLEGKRFAIGTLEGYSHGSVGPKFELGEVGAIVKLALFDVCQSVYVVAPKQLKKFVTANGSADKHDVMHAIQEQWGVYIRDDNQADAYGLAQIARQLHAITTTKRHQLDVLHDLNGMRIYTEKPRPKLSRTFKGAL